MKVCGLTVCALKVCALKVCAFKVCTCLGACCPHIPYSFNTILALHSNVLDHPPNVQRNSDGTFKSAFPMQQDLIWAVSKTPS